MEAGGLGVGAVALAGLFNNVVDSYGYVRLGKQYARDFETSQAKLDLSRLQLSRWGEALGLASITETTQLPTALGSADEMEKAENALGNIFNLLDDAQHLSKRYEQRASGDSIATLNPDALGLHRKVDRIVAQRQRSTGFLKKASWALYRKNDLKTLVDDITDLTAQLVNLFPNTHQRQQELSAAELGTLGDESLPFLKSVADGLDPLLATAAEKAMQALGSTYFQPTTTNGAAAHHGDVVHQDYQGPVGGLSHTYHKALADGKGTRQHCGNVYGGPGQA
ncbi:hypothetical protein D6D08_09730 [Aureobasidium pullulans]|nr:hypothetical protein D6D08_09730 [Aureobasidium pullulans]